MQCPGSRALCELYPEDEASAKSIEGTFAHKVIQAMFQTGEILPSATDEMLDGAELWMDTVGWARNETPHVEEQVPGVHPDNWGTPDLWVYQQPIQILKIWDYKFGHRHVEIFENWQMLNYAAGLLATPELKACENVELTVVQPRSYHKDGPVRTWRLSAGLLRSKYALMLAANCAESMLPEAPTQTGPNCIDCDARHACPTLQKSAYKIVDMQGDNVPFDLPADAIGKELGIMLAAQTLLKARVDGLENEVLARIKKGQAIPGWMTVQGSGREKWKSDVAEVIALGEMMGIDVSKPGAITPKQAIKKGLPAELVAQYSETPIGEVKLVEDDGSKARKTFGGA